MKRIVAIVFSFALVLSLFACGGGPNLDRTITMADGTTSFRVSSEWEVNEADSEVFSPGEYFILSTGEGALSVSLSFFIDPYETYESLKYILSEYGSASDFKELDPREITVGGRDGVIFEYSYSDAVLGETRTKMAVISFGDSTVIVEFSDSPSEFDSTNFDAVVQSFKWE